MIVSKTTALVQKNPVRRSVPLWCGTAGRSQENAQIGHAPAYQKAGASDQSLAPAMVQLKELEPTR